MLSEIAPKTLRRRLVVCINNEGYSSSLERRKIFFALPDKASQRHGLIRVIDETGDDYLYPTECFLPIVFPRAVARALFGGPKRK